MLRGKKTNLYHLTGYIVFKAIESNVTHNKRAPQPFGIMEPAGGCVGDRGDVGRVVE